MKSIKKLSLILAAIFTLGGVAMANQSRDGRKGMDPKERAEKMTERMVKEYNLNDTQKQQLLDLNQSIAEKMGDRPAGPRHHGPKGKDSRMGKGKKEHTEGAIAKDNKERKDRAEARADRDGRKNLADAPKPSAEEREKRMQEMKQNRDNYNAQLQKIMNADQYQAYTKKQTEREQKRQEQMNKMKENRTKKSASEKNGQKS